MIERLYLKTNGSLDGLDDRIGAKALATNLAPAASTSIVVPQVPEATPSPEIEKPVTTTPTPVPSPIAATPNESTPVTPVETAPAATPTPEATPEAAPAASATPEATPAATPTPEASPAADPSPTPAPAVPVASPEASPQATPDSPAPKAMETRTRFAARLRVTGKIKDASGEGIANVVVVLISPRGSVLTSTTDVEGNYSFIVSPSPLSYRLIPSKDGFTFAPIDKLLTGFSEDKKEVDFVGTAAPAP